VTATYDANIVGAIEALVDLMSGNSFAMTREPYAPNYRGLVDAIIDLKEGFPVFVAPEVGFFATAGATINQGQAVYLDHSTGFAYPAIANTTEDQAHVAGFANQTQTSGNQIQILVAGILPTSGLSTGSHYYLSATTTGAITTTPPSGAGEYVTYVGQAVTATKLSIQLTPSIKLS
jgi:hypothetical protein